MAREPLDLAFDLGDQLLQVAALRQRLGEEAPRSNTVDVLVQVRVQTYRPREAGLDIRGDANSRLGVEGEGWTKW